MAEEQRCGRMGRQRLPGAVSSTHNEFRLAARPVSGESRRFDAPTNQYWR
jgi:hypothetical protein